MVYCDRIGTLESASSVPEVEQGLRIYDFIVENSEADVFFQKKLPAEAGLLKLDEKGVPSHFILPLPFDYSRQLACLHEWGHYLDERPRYDANLRAKLEKPKAAKKNAIIRDVLVETELEAWHLALNTIVAKQFKFPAEAFVGPLAQWGLRAYYNLYEEIDPKMRWRFEYLFSYVEQVSPGFLQLPTIVNYFHDASSK